MPKAELEIKIFCSRILIPVAMNINNIEAIADLSRSNFSFARVHLRGTGTRSVLHRQIKTSRCRAPIARDDGIRFRRKVAEKAKPSIEVG